MKKFVAMLLMLMIVGCVENLNSENLNETVEDVAKNFVKNSPTFEYDGIPGSIEITEKEKIDGEWKVVLKFKCTSAGYGNRSGMIVAQVITEHIAEIIIRDNEVVSAIYDGKWDEIAQRPIEIEK